MNNNEEWLDEKYKEILELETNGLIRRSQLDPAFNIEEIKGILKNLYIKEGADWEGRGSLQDVILSATIAAYEDFIAKFKTEL